jgi:hypothetical protein
MVSVSGQTAITMKNRSRRALICINSKKSPAGAGPVIGGKSLFRNFHAALSVHLVGLRIDLCQSGHQKAPPERGLSVNGLTRLRRRPL